MPQEGDLQKETCGAQHYSLRRSVRLRKGTNSPVSSMKKTHIPLTNEKSKSPSEISSMEYNEHLELEENGVREQDIARSDPHEHAINNICDDILKNEYYANNIVEDKAVINGSPNSKSPEIWNHSSQDTFHRKEDNDSESYLSTQSKSTSDSQKIAVSDLKKKLSEAVSHADLISIENNGNEKNIHNHSGHTNELIMSSSNIHSSPSDEMNQSSIKASSSEVDFVASTVNNKQIEEHKLDKETSGHDTELSLSQFVAPVTNVRDNEENVNTEEHYDSVTTDTTHKNTVSIKWENETANIQRNVINDKIDGLLLNVNYTSSSESETEENLFIETMAEEGEEDTPSEGSNDIIEVGEDINTTESELSLDESYEKNSFIDDEENYQLLSGEEYDLSLEDSKKRKRIVLLSSGSDDTIVHIKKTKKKKYIKPKKSRILKFEDSSDDELVDSNLKGGILNECEKDQNSGQIDTIDESKASTEKYSNVNIDVEVEIESGNTEFYTHLANNNNKHDVEAVHHNKNNEDHYTETTKSGTSCPISASTPISNFTSAEENLDKKCIILENILLQNILNKNLTDHKPNNALCTEIKNTSDVPADSSLNGSSSNVSYEKSLRKDVHSQSLQNCEDVAYQSTQMTGNSSKINHQLPAMSTDCESISEDKQNCEENYIKHVSLVDNTVLKLSDRVKNYKKKRNKQGAQKNSEQLVMNEEITSLSRRVCGNISGNFNSKTVEQKFSNEKPNNHNVNIKKRKNVDLVMSELGVKKRKKSKCEDQTSKKSDVCVKMNILDEAILHGKRDRYIFKTLSDIDWNRDTISAKPKQATETSFHITNIKSVSPKKPNIKSKFHPKNFKDFMLYDNVRVKRMKTQQLLSKKIC